MLVITLMSGCASLEPQWGTIRYDYAIAPEYALTAKHKELAMMLETDTGQQQYLPNPKIEALALNWTQTPPLADIVLYLRLSKPHLIQRPAGWRKTLITNEHGIGRIERTSVQRGYVRTHYILELVDKRADKLIDHFKLAHNFAIEAPLKSDKQENIALLQAEFEDQLKAAQQDLLQRVQSHLQSHYLAKVCYVFAFSEHRLVMQLEQEVGFKQGFEALNRNSKQGAQQALGIYDKRIGAYKDKEDDTSKQIRQWLEQGLNAATSIINLPHKDRY